VNAWAECNSPVSEHDLSVTLFGDNMKQLRATVAKETNKPIIENKDTYITCKNRSDVHTFQGAAMGTSWENGRPYVQFKFGNKIERACGY